MKVSEYTPLYGLLFNFDYKTGIEGKDMTVNEMFEDYPDFELTDVHLDQLYYFDLASLQRVLEDKYFTPETVVPYLRDLFDKYREAGGNPFEWLTATFESVNLNPQNYRKDLITTIEKALIEWIEIFQKQPFDALYFTNNPEAISLQAIEPKKYNAKYHVLAYLFEMKAKGENFPIGNKKELERIGNERMGKGKGNTFYKEFNKYHHKEIHKENILVSLWGDNWRDAVLELSNEPELIETYLKTKQL